VGALAGLPRGAAMVSGTFMVVWGLSTLLATRGIRVPRIEGRLGLHNPLGALLARVRGRSAIVRAAATGLLTTLLPCGWLYAFVAAAVGAGSIERSLLTMTFFWLGTLPMMLAAGYGVQRIAGPLRARLPMVMATMVVAMGLLSIAGRLRVGADGLDRAGSHPQHAPAMRHGQQ
jgi:sulfite exporter TauE/SafE